MSGSRTRSARRACEVQKSSAESDWSALIFLEAEQRPDWRIIGPVEDHFAKRSRAMIQGAASRVSRSIVAADAPSRRVLIIGAGKCLEIPLASLATQFDHITVTDIDQPRLKEGMRNELRAAPPPATNHHNITAIISDVMGVTAGVNHGIKQVFRMNSDIDHNRETVMARLGRVMDEAEIEPQPLNEPFDLVIASCVLSQLHHGIAAAAKACFRAASPGGLVAPDIRIAWQQLMRPFLERLQTAFIQSLCDWTRPGGLIYLSATPRVHLWEFSGGSLSNSDDASWKSRITHRMLVRDALREFIKSLPVTIEQQDQFQWPEREPQGSRSRRGRLKPGMLFDVEALILRKED